MTFTDVGVLNKYTIASAISSDLSPDISLKTISEIPASEKISVFTIPGLMFCLKFKLKKSIKDLKEI